MSTLRSAAIQRIRDALVASTAERYGRPIFFDGDLDLMADAVSNALYPEITDAKQLLGVPEGSLLITDTRPRVTVYRWVSGELWETSDVDKQRIDRFAPAYVIMDKGPLTVVWMP